MCGESGEFLSLGLFLLFLGFSSFFQLSDLFTLCDPGSGLLQIFKQAERIGANKYLLKIKYNESDETEMVIRVLSFGPMVKALAPDSFVSLIKEKLIKQKNCGLF